MNLAFVIGAFLKKSFGFSGAGSQSSFIYLFIYLFIDAHSVLVPSVL